MLLELPAQVLDRILQGLDQCSMACAAVTCSRLRNAAPASTRGLALRFRKQESVSSFNLWLERHTSSMAGFTELSVTKSAQCDGSQLSLVWPPCPQLRQLQLQGRHTLELVPAPGGGLQQGWQGLLSSFTALTALTVDCIVLDSSDAIAAVAASPKLQHLSWQGKTYWHDCAGLQPPTGLTHLCLKCCGHDSPPNALGQFLGQLSALVKLEHLQLKGIPSFNQLPCGLLSQLAKLTCLHINYHDSSGVDLAQQLSHLSSATALQKLVYKDESLDPATIMPSIKQLAQLTSLKLECLAAGLVTATTRSWTHVTALQRLALRVDYVDVGALATLTQLRALSLEARPQNGPPEQIMEAVAAMSQLTELTFSFRYAHDQDFEARPAAAAITALTANTNLRSLTLYVAPAAQDDASDLALFAPGKHYPHLHFFSMEPQSYSPILPDAMPLGQAQLQQLCSCRPNLDSLDLLLRPDPSGTTCAPLLQLTKLTRLGVKALGGAAVTSAVHTAAQLTGLKQLHLENLPDLGGVMLLQLTALTALEELRLVPREHGVTDQLTASEAFAAWDLQGFPSTSGSGRPDGNQEWFYNEVSNWVHNLLRVCVQNPIPTVACTSTVSSGDSPPYMQQL
jgi:hypothetical protein